MGLGLIQVPRYRVSMVEAVPRGGIVQFSIFKRLAFPNFSISHTELHRVFREIPKLAMGGQRFEDFPRSKKLTAAIRQERPSDA
jgi:hypothetical protein